MERRFGRYAIRNLTMYLLAGYAIGYLLSFTMPQLLTYFTLEPALILKGQVWRLLSWVIIPPNDNIIFVIFMMLKVLNRLAGKKKKEEGPDTVS